MVQVHGTGEGGAREWVRYISHWAIFIAISLSYRVSRNHGDKSCLRPGSSSSTCKYLLNLKYCARLKGAVLSSAQY